ncbi:hypothetical protein AOPFMNJM_3718 [Methylobacterium jeotgali]|uniref:Uncharacterized protein n=1 Tax=Methylobacterium jeotgali TaxID=381630 RepID=A0ABQ4SYT9_9HYPH|nr:hypothetical protein AOPFMNJM_3718 [Methylobacterium jeotgali]
MCSSPACIPFWFRPQYRGMNGAVRTSSSIRAVGTAREDRAFRLKTRWVISSAWIWSG